MKAEEKLRLAIPLDYKFNNGAIQNFTLASDMTLRKNFLEFSYTASLDEQTRFKEQSTQIIKMP